MSCTKAALCTVLYRWRAYFQDTPAHEVLHKYTAIHLIWTEVYFVAYLIWMQVYPWCIPPVGLSKKYGTPTDRCRALVLCFNTKGCKKLYVQVRWKIKNKHYATKSGAPQRMPIIFQIYISTVNTTHFNIVGRRHILYSLHAYHATLSRKKKTGALKAVGPTSHTVVCVRADCSRWRPDRFCIRQTSTEK